MAVHKRRIDVELVERGLVETRTRAQALVLAGLVFSDQRMVRKAGEMIGPDQPLSVRDRDHPWVSRGGLKLVAALDHFAIDPLESIALDVGASTGGFTDVLLSRGAALVYAVDVGHGQLAWKLRQDARVVVLEQTNARTLTRAEVPHPVHLIVCDASFIGLEVILPAALALAAPGAHLVALIKPQFEVGRENVGKGGIVRDPELHRQVCERITTWLSLQPGWQVTGVIESPVLGAKGNKEFLLSAAMVLPTFLATQ